MVSSHYALPSMPATRLENVQHFLPGTACEVALHSPDEIYVARSLYPPFVKPVVSPAGAAVDWLQVCGRAAGLRVGRCRTRDAGCQRPCDEHGAEVVLRGAEEGAHAS